MERKMDKAIVGRVGNGGFERALRVVLMVYLSPVIAIVMAIGFVGMLAARVGKPVALAAVEGVHTDHKLNGPIGFMKRNRSASRMASTTTRSLGDGRSNIHET
jgi:hypothetical protein